MAKKDTYQVTVIYKALLQVDVKASNEEEAKKLATELVDKRFNNPGHNNIDISDYQYSSQGVVNFSKSWGELNNY